MPDTVFLSERIEVTRPIPAPPSAIFDILASPRAMWPSTPLGCSGHVLIDLWAPDEYSLLAGMRERSTV